MTMRVLLLLLYCLCSFLMVDVSARRRRRVTRDQWLTDEQSCYQGFYLNNGSCESRKIYFNVALTKNFRGRNEILKFNEILNNGGDGYKTATGRFVAPFDGVFHFQVNAIRKPCSSKNVLPTEKKCEGLDLHVMHNDVISASAADYGDDFQSISISTILELSAGDTVWVKLSGEIYGDSSRFTTFQGHLQGDQKTYFNRAISGDVIHGCYKYLRLK